MQQELNIWNVTRVEVFINYNIYCFIRLFLINHQITVPNHHVGTNLMMIRVVIAIWPEQEHENERSEVIRRWSAHRDGRITYPYFISEGQTPRQNQNGIVPTPPSNNNGNSPRPGSATHAPPDANPNASLFAKMQTFYNFYKVIGRSLGVLLTRIGALSWQITSVYANSFMFRASRKSASFI